MGRPLKLDAATSKDLVDAITGGADVASACAAAGIGERTFYTWMAEGEAPEPAPPASRAKKALAAYELALSEYAEREVYRQFRQAITRARGAVRARATAYWLMHFKTDWRACAEYLARTDPEHWAPTEKRILMGDPDAPIQVTDPNGSAPGLSLSGATNEQLRAILAALCIDEESDSAAGASEIHGDGAEAACTGGASGAGSP